MIFLETLYNLPNGTTNLDNLVVQVIAAVPGFTPLLLLFVYFVVFLGGVARQKARLGTADYAMWSVVASMATFIISLILTLASGLISLTTLVIVVVISIFSAVWLFLDRRSSEV